MITLLVTAGVLLFLAVDFVLYCCLKKEAKADKIYERLNEIREWEGKDE